MPQNAFWHPATEPTGEELEQILFKTFLQNVFCTQHSAASREATRLGRKRQRPPQRKPAGDDNKVDESIEGRPLLNMITSLVRRCGVPYQAHTAESSVDTLQITPASMVMRSHTLSEAVNALQEGERVPDEITHRPRSALATLIESVRKKEHLQVSHLSKGSNTAVVPTSDSHSNSGCSAPHRGPREYTPPNGEEEEEFGVSLPFEPTHANSSSNSVLQSPNKGIEKHPSQMSQDEFLRQFKRAPRRGEIGYDAESVAAAEAVGYVMSGSRNKEKQHYVDSIQRKLHEKEARKLRLQFRKVEDERNDNATVERLLTLLSQKGTSEASK
ncbi:hypothetical protein DQ04_00121240 [Trypanosoma grayi]|uniref:hypothetical protein n=1 Tax=Trypanosoma grayi TaxID=71804 RepID=UPI0004F42C48|nr:hypothetical protein DQ04_00121240 [Trypanosoma grayi]KEG15292.1 hypothetical protein DQ04_00121240 [Trypanosoma grayi]